MRSFSTRMVYYSVHSLRDGTIVLAIPSRKPRRHRHERGPVADEEGCFNWFDFDDDELKRCTDWAKSMVYGAIANRLNTKKLLKTHVEARLIELERKANDLVKSMSRIEAKLR